MRKYIQNLKSKPEAERKQVAYMATVVCMVFVGSVWIYGLVSRLSTKDVADQAKADTKPFAMLANSLKDTYTGISASVGNAKSVSDTVTVKEEKMIDLIPVETTTQ